MRKEDIFAFEEVLQEQRLIKKDIQEKYLGKQAVDAYNDSNREVSLFLMKTGKIKIWKAPKMLISRFSELGKVLDQRS